MASNVAALRAWVSSSLAVTVEMIEELLKGEPHSRADVRDVADLINSVPDSLQSLPGLEGLAQDEIVPFLHQILAETQHEDGWGTDDGSDASDSSALSPHAAQPAATQAQKSPRCAAAAASAKPAQQRDAGCAPEVAPYSGSGASRSAWFAAAKGGNVAGLHVLHAQEPSLLHATSPGVGHTALHWAAAKGHVAATCWLLSQAWGRCECAQRVQVYRAARRSRARSRRRGAGDVAPRWLRARGSE